jgi:hypothetical protein
MGGVKVAGLRELRKELRKLDDSGLTDELRQANIDVAEMVVRSAQGKASTRQQRKAAGTLRPGKQAGRAVVIGGNAEVPWFGGAEFGAAQGQRRVGPSGRTFVGFNQFEPWRGNGSDAGYFLYPAIRDDTPQIIETYGDALDRITRKAFPDGGIL